MGQNVHMLQSPNFLRGEPHTQTIRSYLRQGPNRFSRLVLQPIADEKNLTRGLPWGHRG